MPTQSRPTNRSFPAPAIIPVLPYPDVRAAVAWLGDVFGFVERLQIAAHRAQLDIGADGAMIVAEYIDKARRPTAGADHATHAVMVRVADVDAHHAHAVARGARILAGPETYPYGERQYMVADLGGHHWTFSQTLADVHPSEWGDAEVILEVTA